MESESQNEESKFIENTEELVYKKVDVITFGILSPKMIKKMASAKVVTPELYDKEGYPVDGGLMDIRMGVIDPGLKCKTCGQKLKECPGHFGYIEMARPVIHINFVQRILQILRGTCHECGRALFPQAKINKLKKELTDMDQTYGLDARRKVSKNIMANIKSVGKCPHCTALQAKITLEKPSTYLEDEKRLSPIEVRTRLEKITDEDCELFGLNPEFIRPEWMVLTVLSIPPVTMRPSITLESGERSEDDLTHKLGDIVRINQRLFENINAGAPEIIIEDLWDLLQYHVTTFFNNDVAQLPPARHRSGQPLKTITERIKSKEGRIRHNLAGKRTNFSARTVISPDPMLKLNEVGIPLSFAMKLSIPERVTEWNMAYLKRYIEKGPGVYPGANYIVRPDGKKKKITSETKEQLLEEIQPGYTVERHLMDGDMALFNRQPSLHRMSMMCHKIRVLPGKTLRLNPSVCHPYNADFDGDEMNLHVPQTEEARAEAEILMLVQTQLISPRYGLSVIGSIQDAISGNYLLTKKLVLGKQEAIDLLYSVGVEDFKKLPNKDKIDGKDVFSMILPNDFNFIGFAKGAKKRPVSFADKIDDDEVVMIKNGKLVSGVIDKANLGEGSGFMLRTLHKQYGPDLTLEILSRIFKLGVLTLFRHGFTTAINDTDLPAEAKQKIQDVIAKADADSTDLIKQNEAGELEAIPGRSIQETLELKILEILNKARNETGNLVLKFADKKSHTSVMAESGARGNIINLAQMAAVVGQQAMRGNRITSGYNDRTLSCFKKGDLSPSSRGFIRHGFKTGMSPSEFFFGAMTGRDSLMDTALRTPRSGYLYRRLANALQDLRVEYDETIRDASGKIVQFKYGEDGIDVSKSENGKVNVRRIIENVMSR